MDSNTRTAVVTDETREPPLLLSYREVSADYGIKIGTLYALVHDRRIPHVRLGRRLVRFSRTELERWIESNTVEERGEP
jgi:excisionase family DNA binding protein